jgi:uncharacterized protein with FMN-binding domain
MKRSVLVAAGTAVGVTAVVSYHAASPSTGASLVPSSAASKTRSDARASGSSGTSHAAAGATATTSSATTSSTTSSSATTTSSRSTASRSSGTRSAVGEAVSFQYGELEVKVTEHAGRITNVSIARFDITDPHSESIDEYAVPRLRQEVISAQSAHIDGISGASYTSQAYEQSVQSALDKLA